MQSVMSLCCLFNRYVYGVNEMKLLKTIIDESGNKKYSLKIMESESIIDLKNTGERYAIEKGVTDISWLDCTHPTMGDNKLADRNTRFTLSISESEFFVIEK